MRRHDHRLLGETRDRRKIAQRVVAGVRIEMRIYGDRSGVSESDRIAVRHRLRAERSTKTALRAAAIVDHDLLLPHFGKFRADDAADRVSAAAWRRRHDPAHGP